MGKSVNKILMQERPRKSRFGEKSAMRQLVSAHRDSKWLKIMALIWRAYD